MAARGGGLDIGSILALGEDTGEWRQRSFQQGGLGNRRNALGAFNMGLGDDMRGESGEVV